MYFCGLVIVCVRRRVSVRAMKTVSRMVILRSEMRSKTPSGSECPGAQASPPAVRGLTASLLDAMRSNF